MTFFAKSQTAQYRITKIEPLMIPIQWQFCAFLSFYEKLISRKVSSNKIWLESVFLVYYQMICMLHLALIHSTIVTVVLSTLTANIRLVSPPANESISCDVMHIRIVRYYILWLQQDLILRYMLKSISNQKNRWQR